MFHRTPQATLLHPRATLKWRQCTNLAVGMRHAQTVVLNNKVYIVVEDTDGTSRTTASNVYTYDPTMDTWETLQSPTKYSTLTTYHNKLLLVGGWEASTRHNTNQLCMGL